jgi:uncharacterized protein (TIGR02145 family)
MMKHVFTLLVFALMSSGLAQEFPGTLVGEAYLSFQTSYNTVSISGSIPGDGYVLVVGGTYGVANGTCNRDAAFGNFNSPTPHTQWVWNGVCDGCQSHRPTPDEYNPEHLYLYPFIADSFEQTFHFQDNGGGGDNCGGLNFILYHSDDIAGCSDPDACNPSPYINEAWIELIDDGSCEYESCAGCTDASAWNWDPTATIDNGSCEEIIAPSFGCTDPSAFNWDPNAEEDDGSCEYGIYGCTDPSAANYNPSAETIEDGSCEYETYGCTDANAANWDPMANVDDGSCAYDDSELYGCTDPEAINWDPFFAYDDGSCEYEIYGCTDSSAWNWDPTATIDDGSCEPSSVEGCADWDACNPSPYINYCCTVVIDDGSCEYTSCVGCTDPEACNYSADTTSDDGSCIPSGCMNESACNFNQDAGCDDGSCAFDEDLLDCEAFGFEVDSLVVCLGEEIELVAPAGSGTTPLTGDGAVVDEFYLDFGGPSSHSLGDQPQGSYQITVSGTWCGGSCWNGHTSDAAYSFNHPYGDGISPLGGNSFTINEYCPQDNNSCELLRPEPDEYNAEHIYTYLYEHTGGELIFYGLADECCWWDNQAGLSFTVALLPDSPCVLDYSWTTGDANAFISIQPEASAFLGVTVSSSTEQCTDSLWIEVAGEGCSDAEACNFSPADLCTLDCIYPVLGAEDCLQGAQTCGEGTTWNAVIQQCVSDDASAPCGEGTYWDAVNEECAVLMPSDANFDGCVGMIDLLDLLTVFGTCNEAPWSCGEQLEYQGYDYETVQIGEQCWFAENARFLPEVSPAAQGSEVDGLPHAYVYGYDGSVVSEAVQSAGYANGALYNFDAVVSWEICPAGWYVPGDEDWMTLESFLGMDENELEWFYPEQGFERGADEMIGFKLKSVEWDGGNSTGFSALSNGWRWTGVFAYPEYTNFWTSTQISPEVSWARILREGESGIARQPYYPHFGKSVRCVQDSE